jgi:N-acyl-D-amino-acid deacylase
MLIENEGDILITDHGIGEEDIIRIMKHPLSMIGSDGMAISPEGPFSKQQHHPRSYGAYTRVLGQYVRKKGVLTLSEAVRKMTGFPAQKLGLIDRGYLMEGMYADIVIFDKKTVSDTATFLNPHHFSKGIAHVLVNGKLVIENTKYTSNLPGQILRNTIK